MKKFVTLTIPFFLQHLLCCGALLFFLVSSGYLLLLREEATRKLFLLPGGIIVIAIFLLYRSRKQQCSKKEYMNAKDELIINSLYLLFSFLLSLLFMIYIFLPWWLPNYKGGALLP